MEFMPKRDQVNFRLKPEIKADLEAIADFHGLSVTSYIHSMLVRQLRIEREATPEAFAKQKLAPVIARIEPAKKEVETTKEDVRRMVNDDELAEMKRRLSGGKGVPLAPRSKNTIPLVKNTQQKKRKAQ